MSIIGTFPTTIANGQIEDATVVMSLFSWIQSQTNGNGCPATTGTAVLKGDGAGGTIPAVSGTDYAPAIASGMLFDFAGTSVPTGYLACDGSAVSRTTYSALYAVVGTTWGAGDGVTTFNVPDLRRKVTIGSGGTTLSGPANTVGSVGGLEVTGIVSANLPPHTHGVNINSGTESATHTHTDSGHHHSMPATYSAGSSTGGGIGGMVTPQNNGGAPDTNNTSVSLSIETATHYHQVTGNTDNGGFAGTAMNTMQPSAVVTKIIKT